MQKDIFSHRIIRSVLTSFLSAIGFTAIHLVLYAIPNNSFSVLPIMILFFLSLLLSFLIIILLIFPRVRKRSEVEELIPEPQERNYKLELNYSQNLGRTPNEKINEYKEQMDKYKLLSDYRKKFLGNISHELKTPLFTIQGYLHALLDGALFDKKRNIVFIKKALKSTDRLGKIIKDLDTISKLEEGEIAFENINFDLHTIIELVIESLELKAESKNISLEYIKSQTDQLMVHSDQDKVYQVIQNLVSNGIRYGKKGGFVRIRAYKENQKVFCKIEDNGIGIPEEHLVQIFNRFYRVDSHRSRKKGGSGLGLSIVKHIIKAMGENIWVHSEINVGSVFKFSLKQGKRVQGTVQSS